MVAFGDRTGQPAALRPLHSTSRRDWYMAQIPVCYRQMGSLEFSKKLLIDAKVAVSPGVGFGEFGEDYVRFGLIENEHRTRQAIRSIKRMIKNDGFA